MYNLPAELRCSPDHLWVRAGPGTSVVRVGITDFAQQSLGDVMNLTLPTAGRAVQAGRWCGDIESTKSTSDLIAPVSATVTTVNDLLLLPSWSIAIRTAGAGYSMLRSTSARGPSSSPISWMPTPTAVW
jgi:glycine cleavage system H lipoate-binding protein